MRVYRIEGDTFGAIPLTWRSFIRILSTYDLAHVHSFNTAAFDTALLTTKIVKTPLILTDHGSGTNAPGRLLGLKRLKWVTGLAAVSEWSAYADMHWPTGRPHRIIYGGGDHVSGGQADTPSLTPRTADFMHVGRILPHKGIHVLIDALPSGASLRVVGPLASGDRRYLGSLRERAQGKSVKFINSPTDEDLIALYRTARFTVLASVHQYGTQHFNRPELLGLVLLESLALGTPCIGSDLGGAGELLRLTGMPTARPGSVSDWHRVLRELCTMSDREYETYSARALEHRMSFTWESVAKRCLSLYTEVCAQ